MAVFSVNQATQFYVGEPTLKTNGADTYFEVGGEVTDRIKEGHILSYKVATVSELDTKYMQKTIDVKNPNTDEEYLIKLFITTDAGPQYAYIKSVPVLGKDLTTAKVVEALNKAAKRDPEIYYTVSGAGAITPEVYHVVGKRFVVPQIEVEIVALRGKDTQDLRGWVTSKEATLAGTGLKKLQDLEYFCAGEKGDIYRGTAWPNDIPFVSKLTGVTNSWNIHNIHYYEDLSNEASQKSEKTMIIVTSTDKDIFTEGAQ